MFLQIFLAQLYCGLFFGQSSCVRLSESIKGARGRAKGRARAFRCAVKMFGFFVVLVVFRVCVVFYLTLDHSFPRLLICFSKSLLNETITINMGPKKGKGKKGKVEEEKAEPTGTAKRRLFLLFFYEDE